MRRWILSIFFGVVLVSSAVAEHSVLARVTVYWRSEGQPSACWHGIRLHSGHCAVDPKKIPYGSKVSFADCTCVAVDTGPAVVSRKAARKLGRTAPERDAIVIDRFFESKREAMAWAKSHPHFMIVRIQTPSDESEESTARLATTDRGDETPAAELPHAHTFASHKARPTAFQSDRGLLATTLFRCARRRT
jgi:3D (Asp-Asp-Asp) domain-containing protein